MNRTGWLLSEIDVPNHAVPYEYASRPDSTVRILREKGFEDVTPGSEGHIPHCLYSFPTFPDGLLRTSVRDFAQLLIAYIGNGVCGGKRVLQERTLQEILKRQVDQSKTGDAGVIQGLAWRGRDTGNGRTLWTHSGGDPGIRTIALLDLANQVGLVVLANGAAALGDIVGRLLGEARRLP